MLKIDLNRRTAKLQVEIRHEDGLDRLETCDFLRTDGEGLFGPLHNLSRRQVFQTRLFVAKHRRPILSDKEAIDANTISVDVLTALR